MLNIAIWNLWKNNWIHLMLCWQWFQKWGDITLNFKYKTLSWLIYEVKTVKISSHLFFCNTSNIFVRNIKSNGNFFLIEFQQKHKKKSFIIRQMISFKKFLCQYVLVYGRYLCNKWFCQLPGVSKKRYQYDDKNKTSKLSKNFNFIFKSVASIIDIHCKWKCWKSYIVM